MNYKKIPAEIIALIFFIVFSVVFSTGGYFATSIIDKQEAPLLDSVHTENKKLNNPYIVIIDISVRNIIKELNNQIERISLENKIKEIDEYYKQGIGLELEWQKNFYDYSNLLDVDYELTLSIASNESDFNHEDLNDENSNGTFDYGIMQVNECHIGNLYYNGTQLDIYDRHDNIMMGILIIRDNIRYWEERGHEDDELYIRALNSYNMGYSGYEDYMKEHRYDEWYYGNKVMAYYYDLKQVQGGFTHEQLRGDN